MERLAGAYEYSISDLLTYDLGFPELSLADLDLDPSPRLLEYLAERTGIGIDQLNMMTVKGWVPSLLDTLHADADPQRYDLYVGGHSIVYPRLLRSSRSFPGWVPWIGTGRFQQNWGCRYCLKEGPEPYRRLSWRMVWMTSCPLHEILLEEGAAIASSFMATMTEAPVPAPPEILIIDRFTLQAIEDGAVSLPHMQVSGAIWLNLLRTVLNELSLPTTLVKSYTPTLSKIWRKLDLRIR